MAFFVISISSDSSEESVRTSNTRDILFNTIPTTIPRITPTIDLPVIHDDALLTPTISPTIPIIPPWRSRVAARSSPPSSPICQILPAPPELPSRPAVLVLPGQPIPIGRPYNTQPDGVLKMLTTRKSVESLPVLRLALRYPSDSSSSDSSSRYSSSGYAISDSLDDSSTAAFARPSRKRCGSLTLYVPAVFLVRGALSLVRVDLSPPPKRIRDFDSVTDLKISSEDGYERQILMSVLRMPMLLELEGWMIEMWLRLQPRRLGLERDTVEVEVDPRVGPVIEDDACKFVREDVLDHLTADGAVEVIESEQRLQRHRITRVDLEVTTMTKGISALEQDNIRLRGMLDVDSQRVDRLQRGLSQIKKEQQEDHVKENVNNENGNENGNGNPNVNNGGVVPVARECTYQDFVKCQPLNFKYATCTLLDGALTWWNSHKRTIGVDDAYAMTWKELMKLMTEVYCPRNEIQKIRTELWNLKVKSNDLIAYNQRFQELTLLCTKMVPEEKDKVKKYIGCLPDNIQGNVIAAEPTRL
ncbi:reverse transcriptase domain-containing protein [Tanacetum coccineum]